MAKPRGAFVHEDGISCIRDENGDWYTPYDAGGEGPDCQREHPCRFGIMFEQIEEHQWLYCHTHWKFVRDLGSTPMLEDFTKAAKEIESCDNTV
jgi:hypothetical protein